MIRRRIGSLEVSAVGLGCNQIGTTCDEDASRPVVHAALDSGINFFDTADEYGDGRSEELLGRILQGHRNEVVIATKFGCRLAGDASTGGASARWVERAAEDSLRRLRTDRIDLYQLHFPDESVPIEETLTALDRLVRAGKVREIGVCNLGAAQLDAAVDAARAGGLALPVTFQARYNLLRQEAADELIPAGQRHGMGLLPFFPLASGLLSGKYRRGEPPAPGSRMADNVPPEAAKKILSEATFDKLESLTALAASRQRTLLDLAVAWLASQPVVASVICGATKPSQVKANAAAGAWRLDAEILAAAGRAGLG